MIDPRKQLAIINLMLCGLLLSYSVEYVAKSVILLAQVAGQYFQ